MLLTKFCKFQNLFGSHFRIVDNTVYKPITREVQKAVNKYLQTKNIPDPDFLIRTGNTKRLSNFLLWQLAYSEIFFEKKLWPEFKEKDYNRIIRNYKSIKFQRCYYTNISKLYSPTNTEQKFNKE